MTDREANQDEGKEWIVPPAAWQWRYVGETEWKTPSGGRKITDEELKRERPIEQRPLYANEPQGVREAFKAGWYVNAAVDDQPADYLAGCEEVDWQEYEASRQIERLRVLPQTAPILAEPLTTLVLDPMNPTAGDPKL